MTWRELAPENLSSLRQPLIVDVRSPCEHAAENIPDSINIPLLDNDERAIVGTLYAQQGEIAARRLAVKIISPKIPEIIDRILELRQQGQSLVVHCWRGGLRSEAVASFLSLVGIDSWRLTGGYKAWRKIVVNELTGGKFQFSLVTLQGQTGTGKTDVLSELAKRGLQTFDLEALANHRGSVFGGIGLGEQPSQKNFEADFWMKAKQFGSGPVFIEGEGKKIGRLAIPEFVLNSMQTGKKILVTGSVEARVERIYQEYAGKYGESSAILDHAFSQLANLKERLGGHRVEEIERLIVAGEARDAIRILLVEYYDPMYDKQIKRFGPYHLTVDGDTSETAAATIFEWVSRTIASAGVDIVSGA